MWLPTSVCQAFEDAFGLTWNPKAQLYLLSKEQHNNLISENPTFTFTLSSGSSSVDISLPYAAFDLDIRPPLVNQSTKYFPLKRAQNDTQYTLGRVFLQEAYVIADYDRRVFRVAQALHPSNEDGQDLVSLQQSIHSNTNVPGSHKDHSSSNTGIVAGATVGGMVVALAVAVVAFLCIRRRRKRRQEQICKQKEEAEAEALTGDAYELPEKRGLHPPSTTQFPQAYYAEVDGNGNDIHELGGVGQVHQELEGEQKVELPTEATMVDKRKYRYGPHTAEMAPVELAAPLEMREGTNHYRGN
jgi:hypothetical protein